MDTNIESIIKRSKLFEDQNRKLNQNQLTKKMKKILSIVALVAGVAYISNAQGLINFANSSGAATRIITNSAVGGAGVAAGYASPVNSGTANYYYALFVSQTATTVSGSSSAVIPLSAGNLGTYVYSDPADWTFIASGANGATRTGQILGPASVNTLLSSATAQFVVLGWSANIGTSWGDVQTYLAGAHILSGAYVGESPVSGAVTLGNGTTIPTPLLFNTSAPLLQGFTLGLVPVPEPSTLALAGLGGLSLLLFRRRK
jgi:hypothetical protein